MRSSLLYRSFSWTLIAWTSVGVAGAAEPEPPKNLQVFPKNIERDELIAHMRDFAFALGVACTHCHGTEEQTGFRLKDVDFSLDVKPTKAKARQMIRMTEEINSKLMASIPASELDLKVTCFTCHSGIPLPEAIEDRMLRLIRAEGVDAAIADYRTIREENHGSAAYNFGEQPLVELASALREEGQFQAALEISQLNLEFHSDSGQSLFGVAEAYFGLGDRESARRVYTAILDKRPKDRRVKARLEELKGEGDGALENR